MKSLVAIGFAAVAFAAIGDDIMMPTGGNALEYRDEKHAALMMKRVGGFITTTTTGGKFLFADARAEKTDLAAYQQKMTDQTTVLIEKKDIAKVEGCPYKAAKTLLGDAKTYGAVALVYDGKEDEPVLSVYPEERVGCLNVTPLKQGVDATKFAERLQKELWRVFALVAGGYSSQTEFCVMQPVFKPADLDGIECVMASPNVTGAIHDSISKFGFGTRQRNTYRHACVAGWAPAPTNQWQQAIWDRVKREKEEATKEPTKPIKIKYDPKKGK